MGGEGVREGGRTGGRQGGWWVGGRERVGWDREAEREEGGLHKPIQHIVSYHV